MPTERATFNEEDFQNWYAQVSKKYNLNPDPDDERHRYDYRAAYAAGIRKPNKEWHWPSKFKLEGHPNLVIDGVDTRTGEPVNESKKSDLWSTFFDVPERLTKGVLGGIPYLSDILKWISSPEAQEAANAAQMASPMGVPMAGVARKAGAVAGKMKLPSTDDVIVIIKRGLFGKGASENTEGVVSRAIKENTRGSTVKDIEDVMREDIKKVISKSEGAGVRGSRVGSGKVTTKWEPEPERSFGDWFPTGETETGLLYEDPLLRTAKTAATGE